MPQCQPTGEKKIEQVRKMLAEGVPHRVISAELHVGKSTICDIGRRMSEPRRTPLRQDFASRCHECGGWVFKPCRACAMRRKLAEAEA